MDKQLVHKFYRVMEGMRNIAMNHHPICDISKSEFAILKIIKFYEESSKDVTTTALSHHLHVSKPAISQMINALEKKQCIQRVINKEDRRGICISLTDIGRERIEKELKVFLKNLEYSLDKMGESDAEKFIDLLEKYHDVVKEISQK